MGALGGVLLLSSCFSPSVSVRKDSGGMAPPFRYAVYYGDRASPALMAGRNWAIVSDTYPLAKTGASPGGELEASPLYIAYLSIGEVDSDGPIARALARIPGGESGVFLAENVFWHSHVADIRKEVFRKALYDRIARDLRKGFSGVFLDTLDSPLDYEERNPVKGSGLRRALVSFVETLHASYPGLVIVANRGFPVLQELAPSLSGVLFEDFCTRYSETKKTYVRVSEQERSDFLKTVDRARAANPALRLLALDYDDPDRPAVSRGCGKMARLRGFSHYVSDWRLLRPVVVHGRKEGG